MYSQSQWLIGRFGAVCPKLHVHQKIRPLQSGMHSVTSYNNSTNLLSQSSDTPPSLASPIFTQFRQWTDHLLVSSHLNAAAQLQPSCILCLTTHLPCAHWKGRSHNSRSPMSSWLWLRVSGSPNLMALWHAKLLRMARRAGGTICSGWPASVHYGYTVRCK